MDEGRKVGKYGAEQPWIVTHERTLLENSVHRS